MEGANRTKRRAILRCRVPDEIFATRHRRCVCYQYHTPSDSEQIVCYQYHTPLGSEQIVSSSSSQGPCSLLIVIIASSIIYNTGSACTMFSQPIGSACTRTSIIVILRAYRVSPSAAVRTHAVRTHAVRTHVMPYPMTASWIASRGRCCATTAAAAAPTAAATAAGDMRTAPPPSCAPCLARTLD